LNVICCWTNPGAEGSVCQLMVQLPNLWCVYWLVYSCIWHVHKKWSEWGSTAQTSHYLLTALKACPPSTRMFSNYWLHYLYLDNSVVLVSVTLERATWVEFHPLRLGFLLSHLEFALPQLLWFVHILVFEATVMYFHPCFIKSQRILFDFILHRPGILLFLFVPQYTTYSFCSLHGNLWHCSQISPTYRCIVIHWFISASCPVYNLVVGTHGGSFS